MSNKTENLSLFDNELLAYEEKEKNGRTKEKLSRLDLHGELQKRILPLCRLKYGDAWQDPINGHKVGVLDATKFEDVKKIMGNEKTRLGKKDHEEVELDNVESLFFVNIISAMKLTIQGRAWSEVGEKIEKGLLFVIFRLLKIPDDNYILTTDEMKKKGLVENREIDAIVFSKDKEPLTVELKLLGIGNPEIGDEALARKVSLFLIDRLTEMMKEESEKIGVKVIEFRQENPLIEIYKFFKSKNVDCSQPEKITPKELEDKINGIITEWREEQESLTVIKKLKEWTKWLPPSRTLHSLSLASVLTHSANSGHTVRAYALIQMLGFASHFTCPLPLGERPSKRND